MKVLFTYLPILAFVLVFYLLENTFFKWSLLGIVTILVVLAKYIRVRMREDDIEFDDRVNANITKWSLRSIYVLNAVLILLLLLEKEVSIIELNIELILIYLSLTLFIPFYIVPTIVKKF